MLVFANFLEPKFEREMILLPEAEPVELAQEAMVLSGGFLYFLPENLGASNRCFRCRLKAPANALSTKSQDPDLPP